MLCIYLQTFVAALFLEEARYIERVNETKKENNKEDTTRYCVE